MTEVTHSEIGRRSGMQVAAVLIAVGVALALFLWLLTDEPAVAGFGAAIVWIGVMVLISTFLPAWVRAKMRKVPRSLGWLLRLFTALSLIPLPPPWRGYELIAASLLLAACSFWLF